MSVDNTWTFNTWDKNENAWVSALQTSYANFASDRVLVGAGFGEVALASGAQVRRPIAWGVSALLSQASISDDLGQIEDVGQLPGFSSISHDESSVPGLDDARFCTSRVWDKVAGFYVNQGRMAAAAGSDYDLVQYRQVMDEACEALDLAMLKQVNRRFRVDKTTGFINEGDARSLDQKYLAAVSDAILTPGHASGASCSVHRNDNLLSTRQQLVDLEVIGAAYLKDIKATIGYKNPALVPVSK